MPFDGDCSKGTLPLWRPRRAPSVRSNIGYHPEETRKFLGVASGHRLHALYAVALALGLRQGEALALKWADLDFEAGTVAVKFALQRIDGRLQLVEPKTERSPQDTRDP